MRIVGLGTQVVDCLRVRKMLDRHADKFLDQVFTPAEQEYCNARAHAVEHYAAVWAGKEAVFRALGTAWRPGVAWTDVEIKCNGRLNPGVRVSGPTRSLAVARKVKAVRLSLAHCRAFATATAIAFAKPRLPPRP